MRHIASPVAYRTIVRSASLLDALVKSLEAESDYSRIPPTMVREMTVARDLLDLVVIADRLDIDIRDTETADTDGAS